jgi:N-acetyl-gamma-glutamylphosphate reductase
MVFLASESDLSFSEGERTMIKVKVVGCGGYGGVGIVELLLRHPEAKIQTLVAATETGMPMSTLYPHLQGFCDLPILKPDDPAAQEPADVVFFSTPDRRGDGAGPAELAKGARVIDYSGDFRFDNARPTMRSMRGASGWIRRTRPRSCCRGPSTACRS